MRQICLTESSMRSGERTRPIFTGWAMKRQEQRYLSFDDIERRRSSAKVRKEKKRTVKRASNLRDGEEAERRSPPGSRECDQNLASTENNSGSHADPPLTRQPPRWPTAVLSNKKERWENYWFGYRNLDNNCMLGCAHAHTKFELYILHMHFTYFQKQEDKNISEIKKKKPS